MKIKLTAEGVPHDIAAKLLTEGSVDAVIRCQEQNSSTVIFHTGKPELAANLLLSLTADDPRAWLKTFVQMGRERTVDPEQTAEQPITWNGPTQAMPTVQCGMAAAHAPHTTVRGNCPGRRTTDTREAATAACERLTVHASHRWYYAGTDEPNWCPGIEPS